MIIAVAKASAETARRPAAPRTGHIRGLRSGRSSSALAWAMASGSRAEVGLAMPQRIAGVGQVANMGANRRAWRWRGHSLDRRP
jgi:hypothetical protein